jgi:hypothetical protein
MIKFLKQWPELLGLPIALAIFFVSPILLRWFDPTTASFDPSILQALAYAIVVVLVMNVVVFIGIKVNFPWLYEFWQSCFEFEVLNRNQLSPIQKLCAFAFFFFCYSAAFLLALKALL